MAMESKKSDYNFGKVDVDTIDPGKCQTNFGWNDLQIAFVNKLNATMGAAKLPVDYIVCSKWDDTDEPFLDDDKMRRFQKPLTGENFKCANKLVYQMLKSACVKSDAWTWLQSFNCTADGKKAWLALVGHYDGTGELNERVKRPKQEIARLLYKDEKIFPFEIHVTKFKENFYVLEKDKNKDLTGKEQVYIFLRGIRSTNTCIQLAEVNVLQDFRGNFESVAEFLSSLIANLHASAQLDYANRHAGKVQRYVNAMGYNNQRGGRGRARQGNCCFGQRGGRSSGRTRDGRGRKGRGNERCTFANNVDITDPHRNVTPDEWGRLGKVRSYVLQLREGGRGGHGRGDCGHNDTTTTQTTSSVTATRTNNSNDAYCRNNAPADQSVVSDITERGPKNGRSFGRGAYTWHATTAGTHTL